MSAQLAIQQTIYELLSADTELTGKIGGIYDGFPQHEPFPYITLGDGTSTPFATFEHMGEEVFINIHIWSRYKGFKEGLEISRDIHRMLSQQNIQVADFGTVGSYFDSSDTLRDPDGITRHFILRYKFIIQH